MADRKRLSRPDLVASARSTLASSGDLVTKSTTSTAVRRMSDFRGFPSRMASATDGAKAARSIPKDRLALAWLSRSTSSARWPFVASAAARVTADVVFPVPPLLLMIARIMKSFPSW
jgi:hypothetical protein